MSRSDGFFISRQACSDTFAERKMSELKIAIQKSGRLSENSHKLLEECGIKFSNGAGVLKSSARNFPVDILFLRDDDIPQYVEQQVADIGILGENMVFEKNKDVDVLEQLGFAAWGHPVYGFGSDS